MSWIKVKKCDHSCTTNCNEYPKLKVSWPGVNFPMKCFITTKFKFTSALFPWCINATFPSSSRDLFHISSHKWPQTDLENPLSNYIATFNESPRRDDLLRKLLHSITSSLFCLGLSSFTLYLYSHKLFAISEKLMRTSWFILEHGLFSEK